MKYIITIIVLVILGFFVWKSIQTKPEATVPQATVSDSTAQPMTSPVDTPDQKPVEATPKNLYTTVDNAQVKVAFKGFGPGKVHEGSFGVVDSKLAFTQKGDITGSVTVDLTTMQTDNTKLTGHLQSKDFFETATYPKATFVVKSFSNTQMSGDMTIKGVTKTVTIPVKYEVMKGGDNVRLAYPAAYTADFTLDLENFGIKQKFANSTVQITLTVPVK